MGHSLTTLRLKGTFSDNLKKVFESTTYISNVSETLPKLKKLKEILMSGKRQAFFIRQK